MTSKCEIDQDGIKRWYNSKGQLHRLDGPAVEWTDCYKAWHLNGKLHRKDGPALEYSNGHKEWYINDKRHRLDGPALEMFDGHKEWYINGKEFSQSDWLTEIRKIKLASL